MIIGINVVDVIDGLLKMIGGILHLLNFPREILSDASTLYHILLALYFEVDIL